MTLRSRAREAAAWLLCGVANLALGAIERWTQHPVPSDWHRQAEREIEHDLAARQREHEGSWP